MLVSVHKYLNRLPTYPNFGDVNKSSFSLVRMVNISDLWPNQREVDTDVIDIKVKNKNLSPIYVIQTDGKQFIVDGHHTVIAKKLQGKKRIKVNFLHLS